VGNALNFTSKASGLAPPLQVQVGKLTHKMLILGFPAFFERVDEGPVLRTFYFKPTEGALFAKILSKEEELAGTLSVESVRIERSTGFVSISVPREDRQLIRFDSCLHHMLSAPEVREMQLPLMLGQSPNGEYIFIDLAAQPHLLVAGTTGSGKSIFTAQVICSLALFRSPLELSFTLVDTKQLDLVLFEGLKHVSSVIRTVDDLRTTLSKALAEIRRRTELMSGLARNIRDWNIGRFGQKLKYKVIVIDELADVLEQDEVMWAGIPKKDRPTSIATLLKQIAQISRAAGIHILAATQRPSVKTIAGDTKANFPSRICFKLATQADSRVVLDENGAEKLLGQGDFLYKIAGSDTVKRAHSAFVAMEDIAMIMAQHEEIRRTYERQPNLL